MNKEISNEVMTIARTISKKKELLKDFAARIEAVQDVEAEIKELNEKKKALINADVECFALQEEIKALGKELTVAAKKAAQNTSFKPAVVKAYFTTAAKSEEAVEKVKDKGDAFKTIERLAN